MTMQPFDSYAEAEAMRESIVSPFDDFHYTMVAYDIEAETKQDSDGKWIIVIGKTVHD